MDKRGLVWINEVGALRALAHYQNTPMYVGEIAAGSPKITELRGLKTKKFTKPGIKAACLRLKRRNILDEEYMKTPKKAKKTPHYSIVATLEVLATINDDYGSWLLDDIRSTRFGQSVIQADMDDWLPRRLGLEREAMGLVPAEDIKQIKDLACISTSALGVVLSDRVPFDQHMDRRPTERAQLLIKHLRKVMHFAAAFDITKNPAAQLVAESLKADMTLDTKITIGPQTLSLRSEYHSEEIAGRQRALLKRNRGEVDAVKP